jgi:transposase
MCAALRPAGPARQRADHGAARPLPEAGAQEKSRHASARDTARVQQARAESQEAVAPLAPRCFTCIDASGVTLALTRRYGRAPRGERVLGAVPRHYGPHVTRPAALGSQGVEAVLTSDGAAAAEVCRIYIAQVLRPTRHPGDIVLMDNLRAHKAGGLREAIEQTGARVLYVPPYSPDLAPIERGWSKLKSILRTAKARTREALEEAIAQALATTTAADARGWFQHGGYA